MTITTLENNEKNMIDLIAKQRGVSAEDAISQLVSDGLAKRVRKNMHRSPSSNVVKFRERG